MRKESNTLCLIFAVVDSFCKHLKRARRKGGPRPQISRNQIIKMIILKSLLGMTSDRSLIRFLNNFGSGLFRTIPDHSWLNRRSKELVDTFELFRRYLLQELDVKDDPLRIVDSTPVPVVRYKRGSGPLARSFEGASFGYCASQEEKYFGYKLHLLTTAGGIPTHFDLTQAATADVKMLEELTRSFNKLITIGDKGYVNFKLKEKLLTEKKLVIVPDRKNQKRYMNNQAEKQFLRLRGRIEITIAQLKDQFNVGRLRAKSLMGLVTRIMGAMLTMTFGIYINRRLGRPDFKIRSLLM